MKARTALVVLVLIAGRAGAGAIDKPKLRQLAELPEVSVIAGFGFSTVGGFSFNEEKLDPISEIAGLQKQMKGDAGDAERYHRLGQLYRKVGRTKESDEAYAKAVDICRRQVREHPDDMRRLAQLGEALIYTGDIRESEKLLRRAVEGAPGEWRAWLALAECVDERAVRAVFGDKAFSFHLLGEKIIPAVFERKPTAEQIAEMRRLRDEARRYYDRAVALAPRETKPYYRRVASSGIHGVLDGALRAAGGEKVDMTAAFFAPACAADLSRIARLSPDDPRAIGTAVFLEVMTCILHKKIDAGKETFSYTDFLEAKSRSVVEFLPAENREFVRWGMDRLEQLTKSSDKGTAAGASEILADLLMMLNKFGEDDGVRLPPPFRQREDIIPKVVEHLRRAVQLDPSRERAWDMLTVLLAEKQKKFEEAIAVARRRIEIKDNAHNRFLLAKAYAGQDQFEKAAEQLRAGLQQDPDSLDCRLGLAAVLLKRGDADALGQVGEQLKAAEPRMKETKSKSRGTIFLLLHGIYAALDDRPDAARGLFHEILRRDKGNTTAVKALAALGAPASPADEPMAIDYLRAREAQVIRKGKQPDSPVVEVRLIDNKFTDDDLFFLAALPQLRHLELFSSSITDAGMVHIKDIHTIQNLAIDHTNITDKGLARLKGLTKLRNLSLDGNVITDAGMAQLEVFQNLERLGIEEAPYGKKPTITEAGLAHLRKLPKLREVTAGNSITDKGLAHLATIPRLRSLFTIYSKITDEGMRQLERCGELRELWLSGTEITDAGLAHLKGLRKLRELHLYGTKITDAGLVHLEGLTGLVKLDLGNTAITDAGLVHLKTLVNLRELNLNGLQHLLMEVESPLPGDTPPPAKKPDKPQITDAGLKHLQGLTKLEKLELEGHAITDAGLARLTGLGKLRWLFVDSPKITDAGLSHIEQLTRLERLALQGTSVTDAGLSHLHALKRLEFVSLGQTKVTGKGIAELRKVFPKLDVNR